ncbi:MAG: hypothetical protein CSA60_02445 [Neptuniibacter caesariensis]|uniref:Uracil-DNA glycosylase-like domain-containing protein n=1 Tax=Neptuniibacter caesariensis TaxID=207954 RepID=A0A2G6JNK7_NEPCE|nr:MAG: hypothetical protein CSA60_02445 [Neptuniibacter caesariensis]
MHSEQEQLRHQYLEAIGVSSWLSCAELPGATPTPDWVNDFQYPAPDIPFSSDRDRASHARAQLGLAKEGFATKAPATAKSSDDSVQNMSAARAALGLSAQSQAQTDAKPAVSAQPPEESLEERAEAPSIEPAVVSATPVFKLAFLRMGDLLVVDSLPPQGGAFGENYVQLAQAIARSVGADGEQGQVFMLPWPVFASKTLDQGREQAVIAVQHKLSRELSNTSVKAVVLFGEAAAQMVLNCEESLAELQGVMLTVKSGVKAVASHSLTEAMQLPGVKQQVWQDLQGLLAELKHV